MGAYRYSGIADNSKPIANLNKLENIEAIDMGDGNGTSTLSLTLDQVLDLSGEQEINNDLIDGIELDFYVAKNETNATFLVDQGINIVQ